jgi:hypothetical protein
LQADGLFLNSVSHRSCRGAFAAVASWSYQSGRCIAHALPVPLRRARRHEDALDPKKQATVAVHRAAPAISGQPLARNGIILMRRARNVKHNSEKISVDKKVFQKGAAPGVAEFEERLRSRTSVALLPITRDRAERDLPEPPERKSADGIHVLTRT